MAAWHLCCRSSWHLTLIKAQTELSKPHKLRPQLVIPSSENGTASHPYSGFGQKSGIIVETFRPHALESNLPLKQITDPCFHLQHCTSSAVPNQGDFVPQGHLATSGARYGCQGQGKVLLAPTVDRVSPTTPNHLAQNVNHAEAQSQHCLSLSSLSQCPLLH